MPGPLIPKPKRFPGLDQLPEPIAKGIEFLFGEPDTLPTEPVALGGAVGEIGDTLVRELIKRLPMDKVSRMVRASSQGYTTPVYHGTTRSFREFNPPIQEAGDFGIHVASSPETASKASLIRAGAVDVDGSDIASAPASGANVMPLLARITNAVDTPDIGLWGNPTSWSSGVSPDFQGHPVIKDIATMADERYRKWAASKGRIPYEDYVRGFQQEALEKLQRHEVDALRYPNSIEGAGDYSYLLTDPRQLKSIFAAFDPAKFWKTKDILAGAAPAAFGLEAALANRDK